METATPKATKSSLNFILHLSDLCKLNGSLPVNPKPINSKQSKNETIQNPINPKQSKNEKIHLSSSEEETILLKLLDSISSLKLSYVELQKAHLPYDPKKIKNSDEKLSSQFESLSKLEILYEEKQIKNCKKSKEQEKLLVVLQSIIEDKEFEIKQLKFKFENLDRENSNLKEMVNSTNKNKLNLTNKELTPNLFAEAFKFASRSVHEFSKPLINLMRVSGWNLNSVIKSLHKNIIFHKKSHKKYAFESYISKVMFSVKTEHFFSMDDFDLVTGFEDPFDALISYPNSNFGLFCREKYLELIPKEMEDSFFGNLDHHTFVTGGGHPRTLFYERFVKMAKWVWVLREMSLSFIPKGEMFYIKEGDLYDNCYMESVVSEIEIQKGEMIRVGFTVLPGFNIGEMVVRSRVYLAKSFGEF